ncbi:hypothetical protein Tco_0494324 [Tanacetum coccineum]
MPGGRRAQLCEAKTIEPTVHEPPEVELKELPPHLEYAFLEGDDKKWISSKRQKNQAKMTKLSMEWKRLCKIKAKVQK